MEMLIEIDTREEAKAFSVAKALTEDAKPKRGEVSFTARGEWLSISIVCEDESALRAAANSSLRLADACLSILR